VEARPEYTSGLRRKLLFSRLQFTFRGLQVSD
jgi:hypothetical protein